MRYKGSEKNGGGGRAGVGGWVGGGVGVGVGGGGGGHFDVSYHVTSWDIGEPRNKHEIFMCKWDSHFHPRLLFLTCASRLVLYFANLRRFSKYMQCVLCLVVSAMCKCDLQLHAKKGGKKQKNAPNFLNIIKNHPKFIPNRQFR
jgi:hypothetical protein